MTDVQEYWQIDGLHDPERFILGVLPATNHGMLIACT